MLQIPNSRALTFILYELLIKVSKFQNEFLKSSFLPKYEWKIVMISTLLSVAQYRAEILKFFVHILGETMTSKIHSEIYRPLVSTYSRVPNKSVILKKKVAGNDFEIY